MPFEQLQKTKTVVNYAKPSFSMYIYILFVYFILYHCLDHKIDETHTFITANTGALLLFQYTEVVFSSICEDFEQNRCFSAPAQIVNRQNRT